VRKQPGKYSEEVAAKRFEAALKGALNTKPLSRKSMTPKRKAKQPKASA
jgi:hypothetical protein